MTSTVFIYRFVSSYFFLFFHDSNIYDYEDFEETENSSKNIRFAFPYTGETWEKKIPRLRWISRIFVKCVGKYILVMYGRVIYFFARQIEIGLYVGNDYELWCSIALHRVRFYKDSGITD